MQLSCPGCPPTLNSCRRSGNRAGMYVRAGGGWGAGGRAAGLAAGTACQPVTRAGLAVRTSVGGVPLPRPFHRLRVEPETSEPGSEAKAGLGDPGTLFPVSGLADPTVQRWQAARCVLWGGGVRTFDPQPHLRGALSLEAPVRNSPSPRCRRAVQRPGRQGRELGPCPIPSPHPQPVATRCS